MKTASPNPNSRPPCRLAGVAAALALAALIPAAAAQAPAPPSALNAPPPASNDQVLQLSPFDVRADLDNSYGAINSNAITRFNVQLAKLPVSADIFTQQFIDDTASQSVEGLIVADSPGAGVSAIDAAGATAQPGDHVGHNYIQLRGFDTSVMQRDSLMPVGPLFNPGSTAAGQTDTFDVERVEVIEGPQALLYSGGGPGGVVNVVSKQAYFDEAPTGEAYFRFDQYGSKRGQLDVNTGNDEVAVRLALLNDVADTRRANIAQDVTGEYGQIAFKLFQHTTVRVDLEQTVESANLGDPGVDLSAQVKGDSRAGEQLSYLLFTGQTGATLNPTTGLPNPAGPILGGELNWNNDDSWSGWQAAEVTRDTFETATIDSTWNSHLSSEIAFGYNNSFYAFRAGAATLYAPTSTTNPTGTWAFGVSPSETDEPAVNKAIRASILDTEDWLNGNAHSQTILGADFVGSRAHSIAYSYWEADSNFNPIYSPAITTNNGRTKLPDTYFPLLGPGASMFPLMSFGAPTFSAGGVNYVRMTSNQVNPALISPSNPVGLSGSGLNEYNIVDNKGIFLTNMTQWLPGQKLTTLAGVRLDNNFDSLLYLAPGYRVAALNSVDYDLGVNYALLPWLSPYVSFSNSIMPPQVLFPGPSGQLPQPGRGVGEEVGVKFSNPSNTLSGSLAFYHSTGTNEEFDLAAAVVSVINPSGLNGSYAGASGYTDLDRESQGVQAIVTASPTPNWRIRFAAAVQDGHISNNASYQPYYNDQFYTNAAGQVTYQNGTVVYVNGTSFSSKTPVVAPTSAGAVPLTLAMMNNPSSLYYANPVNPNGAILGSSAVATVLKSTSATNGSILTGATGLPISAIQITPSFPIGPVTVFQSGDRTLGTPLYSLAFTTMYAFDGDGLKGFLVGGTVNGAWGAVNYYYNPTSAITSAAPQLQPFYAPALITVDPVVGYEHKFSRVTFQVQLNVTNVFNHYDVLLYPSQTTGYSVVGNLGAGFYGEPRLYTLTTTIKF